MMREMNRIYYKIQSVCVAAVLLSASCTADEDIEPATEGAVVYPALQIGISAMSMTASSRAIQPMSPDLEKYVKTMAVFEFDNEGLHEKRNTTYHFIDFINGTVDNVSGVGDVHRTDFGIVETTLRNIALEERSSGTVCLVANVTEAQVSDFYNEYREPGQSYGSITLDKFKTWALPFEYEQETEGTYDESTSGYIKDMYMFGYYQGQVTPAEAGSIRIDLGRLASRLDITVVNETNADIKKRLGYHFDNVCSSAYFFPIKMSMPPTLGAGLTRTIICSGENYPVENSKVTVPEVFKAGESHTRYFYAAAHSAAEYDDATSLHLIYDRPILGDETSDVNGVRIPLCNVHPDLADNVPNGYSLSRNTRYHFTIRLKSRASAPSGHVVKSRSVEYGDSPGEIIVYLP